MTVVETDETKSKEKRDRSSKDGKSHENQQSAYVDDAMGWSMAPIDLAQEAAYLQTADETADSTTSTGETTETISTTEPAPQAEAATAPEPAPQYDPATGLEIDPVTGLLIDPATGYLLDLVNGRVIRSRDRISGSSYDGIADRPRYRCAARSSDAGRRHSR